MHGSVDVVIVNWNSGYQLEECVTSVLALDADQIARIIVVDNASADGSADFCEALASVTLIRAGSNLGFGRACNLGARQGDAPFILFLNPDTRFTEPVLDDVIRFMTSDAGRRFGVCGIKLIDEEGHIARHCSRFPSASTFAARSLGVASVAPRLFPRLEMEEFDHLSSRAVDHVMGAFYMIRRELFTRLGGFDERFFVYYEDLDLSWRAAAVGQGCFYLADVEIFHRGAGTSRQAKARSLSYILESRLKFGRKHFDRLGYLALLITTLFADPFSRAAHAIAGGTPAAARDALAGHALLWRSLLGGVNRRSRSPAPPSVGDDAR